MAETIFTKIINKEIPAHIIYEDDHNLAFLDITPHAQGHTLVVPKTEAETIVDLDEDQIASLFSAVKNTAKKIQDILKPDGFNIGINHGEFAGQTIPHLHVHIMPRFEGDSGGSMHSVVSNPGDKSVEEIAEMFK